MMSIRDKLKKASVPADVAVIDEPRWLEGSSRTTRLLFNSANNEYLRVKALIRHGEIIHTKANWLVRATIANKAGFDRSLINPRRQLDICNWIDQKNLELDGLYLTCKQPAKVSSQKSRRDLEKEVAYLRNITKERAESDYRAVVEAFFSSNLLDDRSALRQENSRLKVENGSLHDSVAQLRRLGLDNDKKIAQLWEILEPAQRITLGWRPA